jgi:hypothetical protein
MCFAHSKFDAYGFQPHKFALRSNFDAAEILPFFSKRLIQDVRYNITVVVIIHWYLHR